MVWVSPRKGQGPEHLVVAEVAGHHRVPPERRCAAPPEGCRADSSPAEARQSPLVGHTTPWFIVVTSPMPL